MYNWLRPIALIKSIFSSAGIDTGKFSAHSTTGVTTSKTAGSRNSYNIYKVIAVHEDCCTCYSYSIISTLNRTKTIAKESTKVNSLRG